MVPLGSDGTQWDLLLADLCQPRATKPCEALHEVKLIAKQLLAGGNEWQVLIPSRSVRSNMDGNGINKINHPTQSSNQDHQLHAKHFTK